MIGQKKNIELIDKWFNVGMPQFICIIGPNGSGKSELIKYICNKLNMQMVVVGTKVDDIREMIISAQTHKMVYAICDTDDMSTNAKNAMLKIVEEPPKDTYFIMTVQDESSLLETIKSRAQIINIEMYTKQDIIEYGCKYPQSEKLNLCLTIAGTPYELDKLIEYGEEFIDYVNLVLDNIAEVEPANAFKSGNKLSLKKDGEGYDLGLFFNTFNIFCIDRMLKGETKYAKWAIITCIHNRQQSKLGSNKQQIYDKWVLNIRRAK